MRQVAQVWPERGRGGLGSAAIGGIAPLKAGAPPSERVRPSRTVDEPGGHRWRQRAPQATFRQQVAGWRARNWRRAVLAWFVLSLIIVAVAAEPRTDFPKAQTSSVPAVRMVMRVAGGLTVAGVPVLLIALP